ncbi:uncharacterized protein [Diabrotica undecimpunctata]|uniref:uncharacterized protein n=1 Tax=Diabrotica undecimpunctata TaxID=50387 RepID=UPI003B63E2CB
MVYHRARTLALLFLVAMNSITAKIKHPVKARLYADDLVILCRGKNITTIHNHVQKAINHIEEWSFTSGLQFNTLKTKAVCFTKSHQIQPRNLYLHGGQLKYVDEVRFLGMIFDQKLTWKIHLEYLKKTCQPGINLLRSLGNKKWGADSSTLLHIYKALVRSKLDYGSIVYNCSKKTYLKTIDVIQNTGLRISLGAHHTSPIQTLYWETREMPLAFRRQYLSLSYAAVVSSNQDNPVIHNVFADRFKSCFQTSNGTDHPFYYRLHTYFLTMGIHFPDTYDISSIQTSPPWIIRLSSTDTSLLRLNKSETSVSQINQEFLKILSKYGSCFKVYTDASKNEDETGAAIYTSDYTEAYKLPSYTTTFSAELYVILKALGLKLYEVDINHKKFPKFNNRRQ